MTDENLNANNELSTTPALSESVETETGVNDAEITGQAATTVSFDPQNPDSFDAVYKALGVPEDAAGYDFKFADDVAIYDKEKIESFKDIALANKLTPAQADAIAQFEVQRSMEAANKQMDALKTEWGVNYERNLNLAKTAFEKAGLTEDNVAMASAAIGHDNILKLLSMAGTGRAEGTVPTQANGHLNVQEEFRKWYTPEIKTAKMRGDKAVNDKFNEFIDRGAKLDALPKPLLF